jgi:hypothetical protein
MRGSWLDGKTHATCSRSLHCLEIDMDGGEHRDLFESPASSRHLDTALTHPRFHRQSGEQHSITAFLPFFIPETVCFSGRKGLYDVTMSFIVKEELGLGFYLVGSAGSVTGSSPLRQYNDADYALMRLQAKLGVTLLTKS